MLSSLFKSLRINFYNIKERLYPQKSAIDEALLKNIDLFSEMDQKHFRTVVKNSYKIKYLEGSLIFRESDPGDAVYIVVEGSVRVFTYDNKGDKVPLARLNKGDYFGEQALLGQAHRTRSANTETILDTTLIKIDEKYIVSLLNIDNDVRKELKKIGRTQLYHALSLTTGFYSYIKPLIDKINNPNVVEFAANDWIFNIGDKADNMYIILKGEVELLVPEKNTHKFNHLILHKGHIFGELGILENKTRAATALAHTNVRLLVISGAELKAYLPEFPQVQKILSLLQKSYQIPMKGVIEQYSGNSENGTIITTVYKIDDNRLIISSKFCDQELFTMQTANKTIEKSYSYEKGQNKLKLHTSENHIIGIEAYGIWDDLPTLCSLVLENDSIKPAQLENFEKIGTLEIKRPLKEEGSQIICDCLQVSRQQLQDLIDVGVKDLPSLSAATGACTACKGCEYRILEMLGKSSWIQAVMKKAKAHNSYIASYILKPLNSSFKAFKPGQHVIVQVKVGNNWIERPYTISDLHTQEGELRITIKKEPKGFFTGWLFDVAPDEFSVNISQPQGDFTPQFDNKSHTLCFAGGIGITPFITFAKATLTTNQRLHLIYTALTQADFIEMEVFNEISNSCKHFTVHYKATNDEGFLTEEEILAAVHTLENPEVYICGPAPYLKLIKNTLEKISYNPSKIHIEEFVHAGVKKT